MTHRRRLLCTALLLSRPVDAAADGRRRRDDHGGALGRRRRPRGRDDGVDRLPGADRRLVVSARPASGHHSTYGVLSDEGDCATSDSARQPFALTFQTDSWGQETSWFLRLDSGSDFGWYVGYGPPRGSSYGDFVVYSFSYCLDVGSTYTLAVEDEFGDGMCCSRGYGGYEYSLGGVRQYQTGLEPTFHEYAEHTFTVERHYEPVVELEVVEKVLEEKVEEVEMECVADPEQCGCEDVKQEDYRGTLATTEEGRACLAWTFTEYPPASYPDADLEGNRCRSPDGGQPWCYTTDSNVEWEYCRVPACPTAGVAAPTSKEPSAEPTAEPTAEPPARSPTGSPVGSGPTTGRPTASPARGPSSSPSRAPTLPPTPPPTPRPTHRPTPGPDVLNVLTGCYGGDVSVRVEMRVDRYPEETAWELVDDRTGARLLHEPYGGFAEEHESRSYRACVPPGNYTFVVEDKYGDGFCCRYGAGYFRVSLDGREVLNGASFNEDVTAALNVGYDPEGATAPRERLYLEAHNVRRREWHERHGLAYVPLRYSPAIAAGARAWAEELLHSCGIVGIEHEDGVGYGENLAKNTGNPDTWGRLYPPTNIVGRWVDFEIGLPYPSNGHLTQALWRASKYLGCGESVKKFRNGVCRVQVCRYGRAGNCDMKRYNSTEGENWLVPMLHNSTRCGPDCPPEGCF